MQINKTEIYENPTEPTKREPKLAVHKLKLQVNIILINRSHDAD